ncbi:MAG: CofH family radical SAM protein [Holophagaceae bacterium]|nr:CofH family radical SAM protein [Holophagaceae bacterium]
MDALTLRQHIQDQRLLTLADKVELGRRFSFDDGLLLYETPDLTGLGAIAHWARRRLHGNKAYFTHGRRMSYTNVCLAGCQFCAFRAELGDPKGYVLSPGDAIAELKKPQNEGVTELHITAGHNPQLDIEYFEQLFRAIKGHFPYIHIKAFTMLEIDFYAKNSNILIEEFLDRCQAAGLASCPGGGAEIFDSDVRKQICSGKQNGQTWLNTARTCHQKDISTNCTMLYGHIEKASHRVDHLLRLRQLQDDSLASGHKGFHAFIPLAYQVGKNELGRNYNIHETTGARDLREIAVARLLLDNVPHIKAYWVMITPGLAQIALSYGADDLDGTAIDEQIARSTGTKTSRGLSVSQMSKLISDAGFVAVERNPSDLELIRK